MRPVVSTIILAALALVLGGLAVVQIRNQDLTSIFGDPPRKVDEPLFAFDIKSPARLSIRTSAGAHAEFHKRGGLWYMISPTADRADFRHLQSIVFASRQFIIEETLADDELPPEKTGLGAGAYEIEITGGDGTNLAHYKLGKRTPVHRPVSEQGDALDTFFIQPLGDNFADEHIYVCAGANARVLLDEGIGIFRDHRPFLFNALQLADIQIRENGGEVIMKRKSMTSPWRIKKPLDLRTDSNSLERLVSGLYSMEAPRIHDPGSVTIPARPTGAAAMVISLGFFDSAGTVRPDRVTLEVEAPATPDANFVYAKVSGRACIFELPLNPTNGLVSLSELPVSVNDLRSRTLLSRPPSTLRSVTIESTDLSAPLILNLGENPRTKKPRWIINRRQKEEPANEETIYRLFSAVTNDKILAFTSDAPGDLAPYGLDKPSLSLAFAYDAAGKAGNIELDLSKGADGNYYAMRKDESGVVQIDPGTFSSIDTNPSSWRDSLLWSISIINIKGFTIERQGQPPLLLSYNFITEKWAGQQEGKDVTTLLNKQRANILLDNIEDLHVTRWLGPRHEDAAARLSSPALTIEIAYSVEDDFGDEIAIHRRLLNLTPVSYADSNQLYYGRLSGDPDYFILSKITFDQLNVDLIEQ